MSSNSTFTTLVSINGTLGRSDDDFVFVMRRDRDHAVQWTTDVVAGAVMRDRDEAFGFTPWGDIAIGRDDDMLFVSLGKNHRGHGDPDDGSVGLYRISEIANASLGPMLGRIQLAGFATRILLSPDGRHVHVLESSAAGDAIRSFTVAGLVEAGAPVRLAPILPPVLVDGGTDVSEPGYLYLKHASLSPDGRYLVTNRWSGAALNVVDLANRQASVVPIGSNVLNVGEPVFNLGWHNRGLIAIHARNAVLVMRLDTGNRLTELSRIEIQSPVAKAVEHIGPWPTLTWNTSGDRIIAGSTDRQTGSDFVVIEVSDNGQRLRIDHTIDACVVPDTYVVPPDGRFPSNPISVLSANGKVLPTAPVPTPLPSATPIAAQCVCPVVLRLVPQAVLADALANPERISGWMQPVNPGVPPGPGNPPRTCLSLLNPGMAYYHAVFNPVIYRAGCTN